MRLALWSLSLLACSGAPRSAREPSDGTAHFTIATFNVYHPAYGDPDTVETIGRTGADLVLLQEVNPDWERALRRRYGEEYPHLLFHAAGGASGLGVLSRFPITRSELLRGPKKHPALIVDVETPAGPVQVLNVHLRALSVQNQSLLRGYLSIPKDHQSEIVSFLGACAAAPTLVVGDFNEGPRGSAVEWLQLRGFRNALPLYHPGQPTWRGRSVAGQFTMTLDHILFDPTFDVLASWTVRSGNSDHWPVVARLELKKPKAGQR